jgi:nitrile hydratase beta subunit
MNGPHDLGGAHGFGPVVAEPNEPWFHAEWERRVFALMLGMGATGAWNLDMSRHARERIPPADYLGSTYYDIWRKGLERIVVERGLVTSQELEAGRSAGPPAPVAGKVTAAEVPARLAKRMSYERPAPSPARYGVGDGVRARVMNPKGHTRLPRYVRGRQGTIARVHGVHVFPDANATGQGEDPQWLYSVAFDATQVFGPEARAGDVIHLDLWEPYLERA